MMLMSGHVKVDSGLLHYVGGGWWWAMRWLGIYLAANGLRRKERVLVGRSPLGRVDAAAYVS